MVAAALVLSAGAARADLIVNGSFENPSLNGAGWGYFTNGSLPGWTSNNNEIEIGTAQEYGTTAYAGSQMAELNGSTYDTISQLVTGLTVGSQYVLNWGYAGRAGGGAQQMDVYWGTNKIATNTAMNGTSWMTNTQLVTATSTSMQVRFAGVSTSSSSPYIGNLLDGVTLNAATAVPEPASIAMMALGISALVAYRMRRRA